MNPTLTKHLTKIGFDLSIYTVRWFFTMFAVDLPYNYVQQILDFYQYEKTAVFVRIAVFILM